MILLLSSCSVPNYVPYEKRNHCSFSRFSDYTCTKIHRIPVDKTPSTDTLKAPNITLDNNGRQFYTRRNKEYLH